MGFSQIRDAISPALIFLSHMHQTKRLLCSILMFKAWVKHTCSRVELRKAGQKINITIPIDAYVNVNENYHFNVCLRLNYYFTKTKATERLQ